MVRACAGDNGIALHSIQGLALCSSVFEEAEVAATLVLSKVKCTIVSLWAPCGATVQQFVSGWLSRAIPAWARFDVLPAAKHLGFYLGPKKGELQWSKYINRWHEWSQEISMLQRAASRAAELYNFRCITTLGFIAQVCFLPERGDTGW